MQSKKQLSKNLIWNVVAYVVQFSLSLVITPIIIKNIGTTANGFVGTANDFTSYLNIITVVFNTLAGRYISIELQKNNIEKASKYFNSTLVVNLCLSSLFAFVGIITIPFLDRILDIPVDMVSDVKITFAITICSYILTVIYSVFATATFVVNRLDVQAIRNLFGNLIKLIGTLLLFSVLPGKMIFVPIAAFLSVVFLFITNITLTKKLTPEIKISLKNYEWKYVRELATGGFWMGFILLSNVLMKGLDNVLANILIGSLAMGYIATARTIANAFSSVTSMLGTLSTPSYVQQYVKNDIKTLIEESKRTIRINAFVLFVPICGFIVFAQDFYSLWLKSQTNDAIKIIALISSITIFQEIFNVTTYSIAQIPLVLNKLKLPGFVSFFVGICNVITILILTKTTNLGVYSMAISCTFWLVARYVIFNPIYSAKILSKKWTIFYPTLIRVWLTVPIILGVMYYLSKLVTINSWLTLVIYGLIIGIITYIIEAILVLPKSEIKKYFSKIKAIIKQ